MISSLFCFSPIVCNNRIVRVLTWIRLHSEVLIKIFSAAHYEDDDEDVLASKYSRETVKESTAWVVGGWEKRFGLRMECRQIWFQCIMLSLLLFLLLSLLLFVVAVMVTTSCHNITGQERCFRLYLRTARRSFEQAISHTLSLSSSFVVVVVVVVVILFWPLPPRRKLNQEKCLPFLAILVEVAVYYMWHCSFV